MIGIDIYDCVVVINTREALEAFTKTRMSLGSDLAVVAGPWGAGGSVDFAAPTKQGKEKDGAATATEGAEATKETASSMATEDHVHDIKETAASAPNPPVVEEEPPRRLGEYTSWGSKKTTTSARPAAGAQERKPSAIKQSLKQPTYSYVKSRGFYAGVQVDGTIFTERKDANATFYGEPVGVQQILLGEVPLVPGKAQWPELVKPLFDTIKGAEGWHGNTQAAAGGGGAWANQMGPDPNSTYGAAYDPVFSGAGENPPPKPPRATADGVTQGVADMNLHEGGAFRAAGSSSAAASAAAPPATEETPGARAKAAEAAAEAEMNREREERERREEAGVADPRASLPPPGYTEMEGAGESAAAPPPAYVDDGVPKAGTGDVKGSGGQS